MIYVFDLCFLLLYLTVKEIARRIWTETPRIFVQMRKWLYWLEYLFIVLYMYIKPIPDETERMVSFCMCVLTMIIFDFMVTRKKII